MVKMKNDVYRRKRGGRAQMINIYCRNCNTNVILYQKDGIGRLHRCYFNRIFAPLHLERLQYTGFSSLKNIPNLVCDLCNTTLGTPIIYNDGRYAFHLRQGLFYKRRAHGSYE